MTRMPTWSERCPHHSTGVPGGNPRPPPPPSPSLPWAEHVRGGQHRAPAEAAGATQVRQHSAQGSAGKGQPCPLSPVLLPPTAPFIHSFSHSFIPPLLPAVSPPLKKGENQQGVMSSGSEDLRVSCWPKWEPLAALKQGGHLSSAAGSPGH